MERYEYKYIAKAITSGVVESDAANFAELQQAGFEGWKVISDTKDHWLLIRTVQDGK